jgi:hypothetical protein
MFVFVARGFTNQDLRQGYAVLLGLHAGDITPGRMSYELRRLRLHGLIERAPGPTAIPLRIRVADGPVLYTRVLAHPAARTRIGQPSGTCGFTSVTAPQLPLRRTGRQHMVRRSENRCVEESDSIATESFCQGI